MTVDYATADQPCVSPPCQGKAQAGLDYEATMGTLTFGASETTKTVLVPIFNDTLVEGTETFLFNLSNPQGGATLGSPTQATVSIVDNDQGGAIQFSAATYTTTEPVAASITVTRTGTSLASGASVQFATSNGTATAGIDYTATVTTLVFAAGETTKTVPIPILAGGASGDETVNLTLSNPAGGATLGARTAAVLTIVDAVKVVQFSAPTYTVTEGTPATITVVRGGPTTGSVTVPYATADGSATAGTDYTTKNGTLTFGQGIKSLSFTVTTLNTPAADGQRTVNLSLGVPSVGTTVGPNATATLTIQDNDAPGTFQFGAATYNVVEGGTSPVIITRTGGSGGTVVLQWAATGGSATGGALPTTPGADYAPVSGLLTFGPAVTSQRVPLTIVNDTIAEDPETVTLGIAGIVSPGAASIGAQSSTTLTIQDNDTGGTVEFASTAVSVAENVAGGKATLTVKRTSPSAAIPLASGVLVDYAVAVGGTAGAGDFTLAAGTLTFAAGQTSAPILVTILNDAVPEANKTVVVTLSNPRSTGLASGANKPMLGASTTATLTIVDEEPRLAFAAAAFSVAEGASVLVPVVRTGPATGTVSVDVTGVSGTATVNTDFTITPATLTFGPGVTKLNVTVATVNDAAAEGAEQATLQLANPVNASLGTPSSATLTIQDNETAGVIQFAAASLSAVEGRTARVTVTRTGTNLVGGVTVGWSVTGGTATGGPLPTTPGVDYAPTSGTITFDAGATSQSFEIVTVDDTEAEGTETVVISLDPPGGGATLGTPSAPHPLHRGHRAVRGLRPHQLQRRRDGPAGRDLRGPAGRPGGDRHGDRGDRDGDRAPPGGPGSRLHLGRADGADLRTRRDPQDIQRADPDRERLVAQRQPTGRPRAVEPDGSAARRRQHGHAHDPRLPPRPGDHDRQHAGRDPQRQAGIGADDGPQSRPGAVAGIPRRRLHRGGRPVARRRLAPHPARRAEPGGGRHRELADPDLDRRRPAPRRLFRLGHRRLPVLGDRGRREQQRAGKRALVHPRGPQPDQVPVGQRQPQPVVAVAAAVSSGTARRDVRCARRDQPVRELHHHQPAGAGCHRGRRSHRHAGQRRRSLRHRLQRDRRRQRPPRRHPDFHLRHRRLHRQRHGNARRDTRRPDAQRHGERHDQHLDRRRVRLHRKPDRPGHDLEPAEVRHPDPPGVVRIRRHAGQCDFPLAAEGYAAIFTVLFDDGGFPDPAAVRFTGPAGSGYTNTPADPEMSGTNQAGTKARYVSPPQAGTVTVPGGVWSVLYKGTPRSFVVPPLDFDARLVVLYPTVTVDSGGVLNKVDWVYKDPLTGNVLAAAPSFIRNVQVVLQLNGDSFEIESPTLDRSVTSYTVPSRPSFADVRELSLRYTDLAGNLYFADYGKSFNIQVEARLENTYGPFTSPGGFPERLLQVFVDVPADSVDVTDCFTQAQSGPSFFVSVVNDGAVGPFPSPVCIERTGTTQFNDDPTLIDIFSIRQPLSGPPLSVGTAFRFNVVPIDSRFPPQNVVTTLKNPEANTATDFIFIPNSSTPTLKPSGTDLTDARLGQNLTVSWSLPSFAIQEQRFSPIVNLADGTFCQGVQQELAPGTTSTTFKFPTTCFGQTPAVAQFCIFFKGENGESSTGCWFFGDPG